MHATLVKPLAFSVSWISTYNVKLAFPEPVFEFWKQERIMFILLLVAINLFRKFCRHPINRFEGLGII